MSTSLPTEPEGLLVDTTPALAPSPVILGNSLPSTCIQSITLVPLTEGHAPALFSTIGGAQHAHLWRYLPSDPGLTLESFTAYIKSLITGGLMFPFTIFKLDPSSPFTHETPGQAIGTICLLNIVPAHKRVEIGHVVFSPLLQRTTAATEVAYLLMKYCFELGYRRIEWKANSLNAPSVRAARRLGFVFEGTFRNHLVVRGRSRDSAWLSVLDVEWEEVKGALEAWLERSNFDEEGTQKRRLEDIREGLKNMQKQGGT